MAKNKSTCHYVQVHILRMLQCLFPVSMSLEGENYGALRVWMDDVGSYSLVCADGFTDVEATTACMDMGYVYGKSICCSAFGDVEGKVPHILNYQFYYLYFINLSTITLFIFACLVCIEYRTWVYVDVYMIVTSLYNKNVNSQ